jgi:alpha,alpha-trehalase
MVTTVKDLLTSSDLFQLAQLLRLFRDSKTFVDSTLRAGHDPQAVQDAFAAQIAAPFAARLDRLMAELQSADQGESHKLIALVAFTRQLEAELRPFIEAHFDLPHPEPDSLGQTNRSMEDHIERMWKWLERRPERITHEAECSTLLSLPHPYIVPGGRWLEMFYWDSYFIALGLAVSGRTAMLKHLVDNGAVLIERLGYFPNGSREYYLGRSQTPYFVFMLDLLRAAQPEIWNETESRRRYVRVLEQEYRFWMDQNGQHTGRCIQVDGVSLNRYWSNIATPRPEGYYEDIITAFEKLAGGTHTPDEAARVQANLFRDLRAACESGWDFTTRWLVAEGATAEGQPDAYPLHSIRTTQILPIDLNAMLYHYERRLAEASDDAEAAARYRQQAARRRQSILDRFWDAEAGWFIDCLIPESALSPERMPAREVGGDELRSTGILSIAGIFPLFCGLLDPADPADARRIEQVVRTLTRRFLQPGGVVNSLTYKETGVGYGQQWDYPNGWPPHQWITVAALEQVGYNDVASRIAGLVVDHARAAYVRTGKMLEKYNVVDPSRIAEGGEYRTQDGFGWTNGVVSACLAYLRRGAFWTTGT